MTDPEVLNAFNRWLCRAIYSLETAGVDCEVTLKYRAEGIFSDDRRGGRSDNFRDTIVRVKKENEATDFYSFSAMIGPAQFRTFIFVANCIAAQSVGKQCSSGQGHGGAKDKWDVVYDGEQRKIMLEVPWRPSEFPEKEMTEKLTAVLKQMNSK